MTLQNQNHEIAQMYHYLSDKYKDNGRFRGLKSGCNESDVKPSWKDIKKAKACMLAKAQTSKASSKAKLEACGSKAKVEAYLVVCENMEAVSSPMVAAAKLPVLNLGEFELWKIRIE
ncbi:hypothetical protein Tco_0248243 [Tanacetum coccineum]